MAIISQRRALSILTRELKFIRSLRALNVIASIVHASVLSLLVTLGFHHSLPVVFFNASTNGDGEIAHRSIELLHVDVFSIVVTYLAIAAIGHLLVATVLFRPYSNFIKQHRNPFRWIEYSVSCSLMLVGLSLATGIAHFATLVMIFFASFAMNFMGLIFENINRKTHSVIWSPFVLGSILGTLPWVLMFLTVFTFGASSVASINHIGLVYGITLAIFALFPLNMFLSAKRIGPWKSYTTTEICYVALSYFAKTVLAGLLYFNLIQI